MNILPNEIRSEFDKVLDWLRERACARQHGLGTKVPWDKEWLVENGKNILRMSLSLFICPTGLLQRTLF